MRRALKTAFWVGLIVVVPGMGIAWLVKKLNEGDPYDEDFKQYVHSNFDKLKTEEQQWLH